LPFQYIEILSLSFCLTSQYFPRYFRLWLLTRSEHLEIVGSWFCTGWIEYPLCSQSTKRTILRYCLAMIHFLSVREMRVCACSCVIS